jgi:hypothetical protein
MAASVASPSYVRQLEKVRGTIADGRILRKAFVKMNSQQAGIIKWLNGKDHLRMQTSNSKPNFQVKLALCQMKVSSDKDDNIRKAVSFIKVSFLGCVWELKVTTP